MSTQTEPDSNLVRTLIEKAVRAATPSDQLAERKTRPESPFSWTEPTSLGGFHAAMEVRRQAERMVAKYVLALRGDGLTWPEIADLLQIPWDDNGSRTERAYEFTLGPTESTSSTWSAPRLYWRCTRYDGCQAYITDHGTYNGGHPDEVEQGHTEDCFRHAAEVNRFRRAEREQELQDERADAAMALITDPFGQETVRRARWVLAHGGRYQGWSTSESLAVALVLRDDAAMKREGYSTRKAAIERVFNGMGNPPEKPMTWLKLVRTAATGEAN